MESSIDKKNNMCLNKCWNGFKSVLTVNFQKIKYFKLNKKCMTGSIKQVIGLQDFTKSV